MMLSKNEIKYLRSLSGKKFRDEYGVFICEGDKLVAEAMSSGFEVVSVYRRDEIGEEAMSRISQLSSPSPSLAVVKMGGNGRMTDPERLLEMLSSDASGKSCPLIIALDGVRDPGNMGTIIRLADWFDVDAVVVSGGSVDIYNPKVVQATMGAIFRRKVYYTDLPAFCSAFRASGGVIFGTYLEGEDIYEADTSAPGLRMLVMGSESDGISPEVGPYAERRINIPSFCSGGRGSESLNVAIATSICCSEFRRKDRML